MKSQHPLAHKVCKAGQIIEEKRPDIAVDSEMEADTAVVPEITDEHYAFSKVKDANVVVVPSFESANVATGCSTG